MTTIAERTMPHSLDAERSILGAVLMHAECWPLVGDLSADAFFRDAHRRIFEAMTRLAGRGVPLDFMTLRAELERACDLDEVGGPAYLAALTDGMPRSANVAAYAAIVREHAQRRAMIYVLAKAQEEAFAAERQPAETVTAVVPRLERCVAAAGGRPVQAATAAQEYLAGLLAGTSLLPTGFADVDALIGGLTVGALTMVAARPSVGKSSLARGMALRLALAGVPTVVFSLEDSRARVGAHLLSWRAHVPVLDLERGTASPAAYESAGQARAWLEGVPLYLDDAARSLVAIAAWCRRLRDERIPVGCVVVDYLQLLVPDGQHASREQEVATISRGLKRLAQAQALAVVALAQLSRASDKRRDKRPNLTDLRESGQLEQDADVVLLIHRQELHSAKPEHEGRAELIVAKNRGGPRGVVGLAFDKALARFENLAPQED